jgi:O-antigen/teichoic acid export membrane protein
MSTVSDRSTSAPVIVQPVPGPAGGVELAGVARGGAVNLLGAVVASLSNMALVVVVAHGASPTRAGAFFAMTSVFLVAETLCRLGADTSLVYFVSRWRALGRADLIRSGLRTALVPSLATALGAGTVLFAFANPITRLVIRKGADPDTVALLRTLAVILPVAVLYDLVIGATRGYGCMRPTVLVEKVVRPVLQVLLVVTVLALNWQSGLGLAWSLTYVPALLIAGLMLVDLGIPPRAPDADGLGDVGRSFWKFTAPRAVAGVAQVLMQRLDIILVAALSGLKAAAIYTAATRFVVVGQFVNAALTAPFQPRLSALIAVQDQVGAKTLYRASTTWLILLSWPLFGACIALAPEYLAIFGHGYGGAVPVVVILSASMLFASACGLVDSVVLMSGRSSWNLGTTVVALTVNVVADVILIPPFGIVGAAVGWSAGIAAANVVPLALAWGALGLHPFGAGMWSALALTGICFVAGPVVVSEVSSSVSATVGTLAGGAAAFVAVVWRGRKLFDLDGLVRRRPPAVSI